ncbi:MAG: hypothetical protein OXI71_12335 [Gemmatimonadota bacterium]|nr:hypothetical protein [Gemmatimonadota bacterium]
MSDGPLARRAHPRTKGLTRPDKWFLGGLDGVVWAPPFPRWLDRPGFWDAAHLLNQALEPCFAVVLLDGAGREIPLSAAETRWRPGALAVDWQTPGGAMAVEERRVRPGGVLESAWRLAGALAAAGTDAAAGTHCAAGTDTAADPLAALRSEGPAGTTRASGREAATRFLVAFTAQPAGAVAGLQPSPGGMRWVRTVSDATGRELSVEMEIGGPGEPEWRSALPSEGTATPEWGLSPFAEGGCDGVPDSLPSDDIGWIWVAVAFAAPAGDDGPVALRMRLAPRLPGQERRRADRSDPGAPADADAPADWSSFFAGFPAFACGDAHLDRYFDYRVYGLGLNRIAGDWGHVRHPCIAEGPGYFHVPITYSAQCHMMEMRWRAGGSDAWGSLLNFLDNQKEDGSLHGRLYPHHLEGTDFYHANWGDALLAVEDMQPDTSPGRRRLTRCYDGLARYARWLIAGRDPEESGMFTVVNHFETGQEYMSRYMAVDDAADVSGWRPRLRLKGIDVTVYAHQLFRALCALAGRLGREGDASDWKVVQDRCASAIMLCMWCPDAQLFTDVDGRTGERTGVKAAVGFYPLLTGLVDGERLDAMLDHLENPSTFGTPFPLPSSSVDDLRFSAEGNWRGKRRNCPWNGRVWPMTTSHVIEGLLRCWRGGSERAGALAAEMLTRFVRMMFTGGDAGRPNCFEHYNPWTGRACHFRGIDDYQHSWVLDLLARGIAGLHVDVDGVEVRPLPHGLERVSLGPVTARGRLVSVELDGDQVGLLVDGERFSGTRERGVRVGWEEAGA